MIAHRGHRLSSLAAVTVALAAALTASSASASPLDETILVLRTRPTGVEESVWIEQRRDAAMKLGEIRDKAAVDALIEIAETERYDVLLSIAIRGLGNQGDRRALPSLQRIYADRSVDKFIRDQAGEAIVALGDRPLDDIRLAGQSGDLGVHTPSTEPAQLGSMGSASTPEETFAGPGPRSSLPDDLRARDRAVDLALGELDLRIDAAWSEQPVLADAALRLATRYVDERQQWGWSHRGALALAFRNGDYRAPPTTNDKDGGNTRYFRQQLSAQVEGHYYFGNSDVHMFAAAGLDQRFTRLSVKNDGDDDSRNEGALSDGRFAVDLAPAGGLGWGRNLNNGARLRLGAIEAILSTENLLSNPLDTKARRAILASLYVQSNRRSSYPRLAEVLRELKERGFLARSPSARVLYRIVRAIDDPTYADRPKGARIRAGFVYGIPLMQDDYQLRGADTAMAGPLLSADVGLQIDLERELLFDTRALYDALGDVTALSTNSGVTYRRYLHGRWSDYLGEWTLGARGGISKRNWDLPDGAPKQGLGYLVSFRTSYAYAFSRGSRIELSTDMSVESGALRLGVGLGLRFGLSRGSYVQPTTPKKSLPLAPASRRP